MLRSAVSLLLVLGLAACHRPVPKAVTPQPQPPPAPPIDALWHTPEPDRDLFAGVAGPAQAPAQHSLYTVLGARPGEADSFDVADPRQRRWTVQLPADPKAEVVASRLLWGVGYHQTPSYLVRGWRADRAARNPQPVAEFRPRPVVIGGRTLTPDGTWSLGRNPFVGTRELAGLIVLRVLFGSPNIDADRNEVYELDDPLEGARAWYVADDVGQSFETPAFITGVRQNVVVFDVPGVHAPLLDRIAPADVRWACERLDRLTDRQWRDAFRAGGYTPAMATRIIRRLKAKVAEGLALPA